MSSVARKLLQVQPSAAGAADTGDDDFASVVLLLDGDGTSGDDNNTFTDSSTNGFTVTENGSVVQGSFSPYGDNWSVYFENNTAFMQSDTGIDVASSNFTIEMWVWATENDIRFCAQNNTAGTNFYFGTQSSGYLRWDVPTGTDINSTLASGGIMDYVLPLNQWVHVAAVREGTGSNQFKMYADGVLVAQGTDSSDHGTGRKINIAGGRGNVGNYDGYISNFRFVVGSAVYTSAFTPPTSPLTNVTNTKLLACQSNRFIDNSSTNDTFTLNLDTGYPKVTPFSPFKDDDARDITTDGGSAYFDGVKTTQLYAGTSNVIPATGDFTIEGWVYFTGVNTNRNAASFFMKESGTTSGDRCWQSVFNNNGTNYDDISIVAFSNNSTFDVGTFTHTFYEGQWYHIAITRTGTTYEVFVNGTSIGTDTLTVSSINQSTTEQNWIGSWNSSNKDHTHIGYFGDFRIVYSRVYTSNFTPPTSPLTAITNTELLLNFQDAGIYDRSGINNIDTAGNAQIDTAVKKYGTGSIEFDGNNDYLQTVNNSDVNFGSDAFTIESWVYRDAAPSGGIEPIISGNTTTDSGNDTFSFHISTSRYFEFGNGTTYTTSNTIFPLNQWVHLAVSYDGTTLKMFQDGSEVASAARSYSFDFERFKISRTRSNSRESDQYLDDLRVTKGVARYTANFTPPTAALPKF